MVLWQKTAGSSVMYNGRRSPWWYGRTLQDQASCIMVDVSIVIWQKTAGSSVMYNGRGLYRDMAEDCRIQRHV